MPLSPNLRGAVFMSVSMAGFTMSDAISKTVAETMNMGQVMLVRGVFATLFVAAIAWHRGAFANFGSVANPYVVLRAACETAATVCFLVALAHLPLATVSAVLQALPLAVTMGAALAFSEKVGWRRWLAILIGFAGVMIIVRPGFEGFSVYSLLTLVCVFFAAVRDLVTKRIPAPIPSLLVSFVTAVTVTACGAALIEPMGGWSPLTPWNVGMLAVGASMLVVGYQFIIEAMRMGDISFIAPFRYTALLWAIVLGFVVFGDVPDLAMAIGAAIVVGSGLFTLYRERAVGRRPIVAESSREPATPDGL
ncbi:MAG: DMT family transporter [Rhizobiaceae bacterium]